MDKETPLRVTLKILAVILLAVTTTTLIGLSIRSSNQKLARTGSVFAMNSQPRDLPDVSFVDGKEQVTTLQDFRGKIVLLNVWATWCPPCRKEMPTLDRLQSKLGGPDFEVVALSIDQGGASVVKSFYEDENIRALQIYIDKSSDAMTTLGIAAIPATLLIDREGREIGRKIGPAEWDSPEIITLIQAYLAPSASNLPVKP